MIVAKYIEKKINQIQSGKIIVISDFYKSNISKQAISQTFSRLVKYGALVRIEKGLYFKPEETRFGQLPISNDEILKTFLYDGKKRVGYISGNNLFNKLGLSTQLANETVIVTNKKIASKKIGNIKMKFIYSEAKINEKNIKELEILDALKNFKRIFDDDKNYTYEILMNKIKEMSLAEQKLIIELAVKYYSKSTQALLGSILENVSDVDVRTLEENIYKYTTFKLGIIVENAKKWRIK